jgi:DNA adenine methylase
MPKIESKTKPRHLPFLKWAGGKRAILHHITPRIPKFTGKYIEPFLGAGAVFFSMAGDKPALLNDANKDLIEVYKVLKNDVEGLLKELKKHRNTEEHYLKIRSWDRKDNFKELTPTQRAARFIYLNKTCFNGLYRVNSQGHFNVPYGKYVNPDFIAEQNLRKASLFLKTNPKPILTSGDFRKATNKAVKGDFVYFDPPYDPISSTATFVSYQSKGFGKEDQIALKDEILRLTRKGIPVLLSNSDTAFIRELYGDRDLFRISKIQVNRAISAKAKSRGKTGEVLVDNYKSLGVKTQWQD